MGRRTWIKIFADNWLRGTLREETPSIRGIWIDILALAGDSTYGDEGIIQVAEGVGLTDEQITAILCIKLTAWLEAKQRLIDTGRIQVSKHNVIKIIKWKKYQSEYERQKPYRQKLQPKVTSESDSKSDKEKREERREKRDKRKEIKKEREKERKEHSLSLEDKQKILKKQNYYLENYGITKDYIQNFFLKCEAKSNKYKYTDFGKTLIVWWKGDHPDWEKDLKKQRQRPRGLLNPDPKCPDCKGSGSVIKEGDIIETCDCRKRGFKVG